MERAMVNDELIHALNEDLVSVWGMVKSYVHQTRQTYMTPEVRALLEKEIHLDRERAAYLSDVIDMLGGDLRIPPEESSSQKNGGLKAALVYNLRRKLRQTESFMEHVKLARKFGKRELTDNLILMATEEVKHTNELRTLLRRLSLI
jgi:hypothetical protein